MVGEAAETSPRDKQPVACLPPTRGRTPISTGRGSVLSGFWFVSPTLGWSYEVAGLHAATNPGHRGADDLAGLLSAQASPTKPAPCFRNHPRPARIPRSSFFQPPNRFNNRQPPGK